MSEVVFPHWDAPQNIHALTDTRHIALDDLHLSFQPIFLTQIHGANIVIADEVEGMIEADGSCTQKPNINRVVRTTDRLFAHINL